MTSKALLHAYVGHRALISGGCSYLGPKGVAGQLALNLRLVGHVERAFEQLAQRAAAA